MKSPAKLPECIALLLRAPMTWEPLDRGTLTHAEANALNRLIGASMIQKRHRIRVSCEGHPTVVALFIELTGEFGLVEATTPGLLKAHDLWKDSLDAWVASGRSLESSGHVEFLTEEWRLSEVGERAKADVEAGKGELVQNFVDKEGVHQHRRPVRGEGRLISLEKIEMTSSSPPADVSVTNWDEAAKRSVPPEPNLHPSRKA